MCFIYKDALLQTIVENIMSYYDERRKNDLQHDEKILPFYFHSFCNSRCSAFESISYFWEAVVEENFSIFWQFLDSEKEILSSQTCKFVSLYTYPGPEKFLPYSRLMTIPLVNGRPVCSKAIKTKIRLDDELKELKEWLKVTLIKRMIHWRIKKE